MSSLESLLTNVYGGALVGVMLTSTLFGIITVQVYKHFQSFPRDSLYVKTMIIFLWILQAFEVVSTTKALYWYLVTHAGNAFLLVDAIWEGTVYQTVSTAASMTTQSFFAFRVYQLSHSVLLGLFLELLVLAQCTLGSLTAARAYIYANFPEIAAKERWLVLAWLAAEALCDTAIATSMVMLLRRQRTGFDKTDTMINTMIIYSINTGAVTSLVALVTLITFAIAQFHFVVLALAPPLGALYTVSILANLHSRTTIRKKYFANTTPIPMTTIASSNSSGSSINKRSRLPPSPGGSPIRKDPSFAGFSKLGSFDSTASRILRPPPSMAPSSQTAVNSIPKGGVHIHVQKQSVTVTDASPPQTMQARPPRKVYWEEDGDEVIIYAI